MDEPYLTAAEAAKHFVGCRPRHLTDLACAGKLIGYPFGLGDKRQKWLFKISEIEQYLRDRRSAFTSRARTRIRASRQPSDVEKG